ncbi:hypothetical protein EGW08_015103, partial [Elysia chlorotica]
MLNSTVADNSTGLPGFTYVTQVTSVSAVTGHKQLCVDIGSQQAITDSACFHIIFTDNDTAISLSPKPSSSPDQTNNSARFVSPTPPDGSRLPCADSVSGCHFLVYSEPGNSSSSCPQVSALTPGVIVFPTSRDQGGGQCTNEVLVLPEAAAQLVCLQAGVGETRCLNVPAVNMSGVAMCSNSSCNSPQGACLADPSLGTTQCVCHDHFSLPTCTPDPCGPNPCNNGGICETNNGTFQCICRLGYLGSDCSTVDSRPPPLHPLVTAELGPTPGGVINCQVNVPCDFPVHITGGASGSVPTVKPGPSSPDVNTVLSPTAADNSTGLPGSTFLTPITATSSVPGEKQLCVNIADQGGVTDSACFHVIFTDNKTRTANAPFSSTTASPVYTSEKAKFVSPTPPTGSTLPCSNSINDCNLLVFSEPDNTTGDCPQISSGESGVYVFHSTRGRGGDQCINEVLVLPHVAPQVVCLQAGIGETRCFNISSVNNSGISLCQSVACNSPHGACLAEPGLGTTQCICQDHFSPPSCLPDPCQPNPCENGGICQASNGTECFCPLGFSGHNCS